MNAARDEGVAVSAARDEEVVALPPDVTMPVGQETRVLAGVLVLGVSAMSDQRGAASHIARFCT